MLGITPSVVDRGLSPSPFVATNLIFNVRFLQKMLITHFVIYIFSIKCIDFIEFHFLKIVNYLQIGFLLFTKNGIIILL